MIKNEKASLDRLLTFAKNHRPNGGFGNLYLIQKENREGEIIEEYYGMNLMTDWGMKKWFIDKDTNFPTNLYVGQGTGTITGETDATFSDIPHTLNERIPDVGAATVSDSTISYEYPLYFSPNFDQPSDTGLITCMMRYMICYYDWNVASNGAPFKMSEYGIGTDVNHLWTHSWIYDQTGERTQVTKNLNERLTITVYMCYSYYESLIQDGWANNRYTIITTMEAFMNTSRNGNRMREDKIYTYKRNGVLGERGLGTASNSKFEDNTITNSRVVNEFTMYQGNDAVSGYFDGFYFYRNGFVTVEPLMLDHTEDLTLENYYTYDPTVYTGISHKFGHASYPYYFTQIDVEKIALYNHKATGVDKWNNYCDFHNDPNHWYDETTLSTAMAVPIYYSNNDTIAKLFVYQNVRTDDPILKLSGSVSTVYATNRYWDKTSWIRILDFDNIPVNARKCRYWITSSNSVGITPSRESDILYMKHKGGTNNGFVSYKDFSQIYGSSTYCDNYEYGWYALGNKIYFVGAENIRTSVNLGSSSTEMFTYGKHIVICDDNSSQYLLVDASTFNTRGIDGSAERKTPLFTANTNTYSQCYRTSSDNGIICLQSLNAAESNIINLSGNNFSQKMISAKFSCAIWGTHYVAYQPADDLNKIRIYDVDNGYDVGDEFSIPNDVTNVTFMCGHTHFIWISDGATYAYVIDIRDGNISGSTNVFLWPNNQRYLKITAVDDAMIIYRYDQYTLVENAVCIEIANPENAYKLTDFKPADNSSSTNRYDYTLRYINQQTLPNGDKAKTLILMFTRGYHSSSSYQAGSENMVYDFGQYLADRKVTYWGRNRDNELHSYGLYGENVIFRSNRQCPLINFMPMKIIGTTTTIGTQNKIKNISGKIYHITFGNKTPFGNGTTDGKPPGFLN